MNEDFIDISTLFKGFLKRKFFIMFLVVAFSLIGVGYSLFLPNIYKSESILISSNAQGDSSFSEGLDSFASLAGINLNSGDQSSQRKLLIANETIRSKKFFNIFATNHNLLPHIFAGVGYDDLTGKVKFNKSIYNPEEMQWKIDIQNSKQYSLEEAYEIFWTRIANFRTVQDGKILKLSIEYFSPSLAKEWNHLLIRDLNNYLREEERLVNERYLDYYQKKLTENTVVDIDNVITALISARIQSLALIESEPEFVYMVIDPALEPSSKDSPRRSIIVMFFCILGFFIALGAVIIKDFFIKK